MLKYGPWKPAGTPLIQKIPCKHQAQGLIALKRMCTAASSEIAASKFVRAGYNNFTGTIANTIPTNSPLQYLHLQNNNLTGKMPATLSNANYLADLNTSTNMMTGSLPASVGGIKTLQSFVIAVNNHTGEPCSFLRQPVSLKASASSA